MTQTKLKNHSAKFSAKAQYKAKRHLRDVRPIHRTIAFHPINLLFLLCAGVLLCASTFSAMADSYSVNATVPAPIPTAPAIITSPTNEQQLSPQTQTISGTCPLNTYIEITDNTTLVGIGICDQTGVFQVSVSLSSGLNVLMAQDYNVTNNSGPASPSINVYYYAPTPPSNPSAPPVNAPGSISSSSQSAYVAPDQVKILQVDTDTPYQSSGPTQIVSYGPTFTGIAPPNSLIVVTIHTNPYYCHTYANTQGYWSCTFDQIIPPGLHTVAISARTPAGQTFNLAPFHISVVAAAPKTIAQTSKFSISTSYAYKVYLLNQQVTLNLQINGGAAPFAFTVSWGDGVISTYVEQTSKDFLITHTYTHLDASTGSMPVKIAAVDTKGDSSSLQVDTVIRNPNFIGNASSSGGAGFLQKTKPWLTVLWPGYIVILLMVFSFWLGERQEMLALLSGKKLPPRQKHRHSHSH
jgi:hypothetical protein